jgi:hypothetical protein
MTLVDALRRLLGRRAEEEEAGGDESSAAPMGADEHSVVAWVRLGDAGFANEREQIRLFHLENRVMAAVDAAGCGTYETNDLERGFFRMHVHGPDADTIVEVVRPILTASPPGSYLAKRSGPAGTSEERVDL